MLFAVRWSIASLGVVLLVLSLSSGARSSSRWATSDEHPFPFVRGDCTTEPYSVECLPGAKYYITPENTTSLYGLVDEIVASNETHHTIYFATGTYECDVGLCLFECLNCYGKTLYFIGVDEVQPQAAVLNLVFAIEEAEEVLFADFLFIGTVYEDINALYIGNTARVRLESVVIYSLVATKSLLAVFNASDVSIDDCYFGDNVVLEMDSLVVGALMEIIIADSVNIQRSIFGSNQIMTESLMFMNLVGDLIINSSTIGLNANLKSFGSSVYFAKVGSAQILDSSLIENNATESGFGAGIFADRVNMLTIARTDFLKNLAFLGHALYTTDTNINVTASTFAFNGNAAYGGGQILFLNGSFETHDCLFLGNVGAVVMEDLHANSIIDSAYFYNNVQLKAPALTIFNCADTLKMLNSTFILNSGGLYVEGCDIDLSHSLAWSNSPYGITCGNQTSVKADLASLAGNGYDPEDDANSFYDARCLSGCVSISLPGQANICEISGTDQYCPRGMDICSRCQSDLPIDCQDCNGRPYGLGTAEECALLSSRNSERALVSYNSSSPQTHLQSLDQHGQLIEGVSLDIQFSEVRVSYLNTSDALQTPFFILPIADFHYMREYPLDSVTPGALCEHHSRVLANGALLRLMQCLYEADGVVTLAQQNISIPKDYHKVGMDFYRLNGFDADYHNYTNIDLSSRTIEVTLRLIMSHPVRAVNMSHDDGDYSNVDTYTFFAREGWNLTVQIPTFAVADTLIEFSYQLLPVQHSDSDYSSEWLLVLCFGGTFDSFTYDPHFGLLVSGDYGAGSSDDSAPLVAILVPVLVGSAIAAVALVVGVVVLIGILKAKAASSTGMVNFSSQELEDPDAL